MARAKPEPVNRIDVDAVYSHDVALANHRFRAGLRLKPGNSAIVSFHG